MKRAVLIVLLAVLGFLLPATAGAKEFTAPTNQPAYGVRISESMKIAESFFGGEKPVCGTPRVYYSSRSDLHYEWNGSLVQAAGVASTTRCAIWLGSWFKPNRWINRIEACGVLVHEYGHLLGYDHSQKGTIMAPGHGAVYACYRRFLPRGAGRSYRKLRGIPRFATRPW